MKKIIKSNIIFLSIMLAFVIILGTSYALLSIYNTSSGAGTFQSGSIAFHYDEGTGRGISLDEFIPCSDEYAIIQTEEGSYFDFEVTAKSMNQPVPFVITARKVGESSDIDDAVKIYLTEIVNDEEHSVFGGVHTYKELSQYSKASSKYSEKIIFTDTVGQNDGTYNRKFRLRMWVSEDVDFSDIKYSDSSFRLIINVYAKSLDENDVLRDIYAYQDDIIYYVDNLDTLLNPDRGLYRPVAIRLDSNTGLFVTNLGNSMDWETKQATGSGMSMLHLRINICQLSGNCNGTGVDRDFTTEQIDSLNVMMDKIRKNGGKAIIRFFYDDTGVSGMEPTSFDKILDHIDQLEPFFEDNKDIISLVEAGFIGPWGEMHSSSYAGDEYVKDLVEALLASVPSNITINVRTPHHYIATFGSLNSTDPNTSRVGIFNDGYLGSATDLGTYTEETSRETFVSWMTEKGKTTFYGGEVTKFGVNDYGYNPADEAYSEGTFAISEMPLTHTNYFNSEFNRSILDTKWKNQTYTNSNSEYNNMTFYKYIIDHLGYRFVLRDSDVTVAAKQGSKAAVKFSLENVGFGNVIQNYDVKLILIKGLDYYEAKVDTNINEFDSGTTTVEELFFYVPSDMEPGYWDVYIKIVDPLNSLSTIRFANPNIYDEDLMANKVGKINIMENSSSGVVFKQADVVGAEDGVKKVLSPKLVYVPVTFGYVNHLNFTTIGKQELSIPVGIEIDFNNPTQLADLGIELPQDYYFTQVSSGFVNWVSGLKKITIPRNPNASMYWINVYVKQNVSPTVEFIYVDSVTRQELGRQDRVIDRGTTIDFHDSTQLADLGITLPGNGYKFGYANCSFINNFQNIQTVTIPVDDLDTNMYWVSVYVSNKPQIEFTFVNRDTGNEMGLPRVHAFVTHGSVLDLSDPTVQSSLGITIPDNYDFEFASYCFDNVNWVQSQVITVPEDGEMYWIHLYIKERQIPKTNLVLQYVDPLGQSLNISYTIQNVNAGTVIDFTDSTQLEQYGVTMPSGYEFTSITYLDYNTNEWVSWRTSYTVATENLQPTYWITVSVREITGG